MEYFCLQYLQNILVFVFPTRKPSKWQKQNLNSGSKCPLGTAALRLLGSGAAFELRAHSPQLVVSSHWGDISLNRSSWTSQCQPLNIYKYLQILWPKYHQNLLTLCSVHIMTETNLHQYSTHALYPLNRRTTYIYRHNSLLTRTMLH